MALDIRSMNKAALEGQTSAVKKDADVAITSRDPGWTPLPSASLMGHTKLVKQLFENGADVAAADKYGRTPLYLASEKGYIEIVKQLLENGADVEVASKDGWTPLHSASNKGHIEIVKLLLENGADVAVTNRNGWTPLNSASYKGYIQLVKLLLENGADVAVASRDRWTPLHSASVNGHVDVVKLLLENGADVAVTSKEGWTPLHSASSNGHEAVVQMLLEHQVDVNAKCSMDRTPLSYAAANGHEAIVRLLLSQKLTDADVQDDHGNTPLSFAAWSGCESVVQLLLARESVDADSKDKDGDTPLLSAASKGHREVVKLLIASGKVDISTKNNDGHTPMLRAAQNGHDEVVRLLLEYLVEADMKNSRGRSFSFWLMSILNPPQPNCYRIKYTCGCGDELYVDVKELLPGGIERFKQRLLEAAAAIRRRAQSSTDRASLPASPPPAHLSFSNQTTPGSAGLQDRESNHPLSTQSVLQSIVTQSQTLAVPRNLRYVLLCVNTKRLKALTQVEVGFFQNDEFLFRGIREAYMQIRRPNEWKLSKSLPSFPRWMRARFPIHLDVWSKFIAWLGDTSIHIAQTADFVRFQLIPVRTELCPAYIQKPSFPPEDEVRAQRYLYSPCPMDVEIHHIPFLHELLKPGAHLGDFWLTLFPKKLHNPLEWAQGRTVIGWGIEITEGMNWRVILAFVLLCLILTGLCVGLYATIRGDVSTAVGLGAYIVAVITIIVTLQYYAWVDR